MKNDERMCLCKPGRFASEPERVSAEVSDSIAAAKRGAEGPHHQVDCPLFCEVRSFNDERNIPLGEVHTLAAFGYAALETIAEVLGVRAMLMFESSTGELVSTSNIPLAELVPKVERALERLRLGAKAAADISDEELETLRTLDAERARQGKSDGTLAAYARAALAGDMLAREWCAENRQ